LAVEPVTVRLESQSVATGPTENARRPPLQASVLLGAVPDDRQLAVNAVWKRNWPPWAVSLLISALVFAAVAGLQQFGAVQYLEFPAYDFMIRHRPPAMSTDLRFALIG